MAWSDWELHVARLRRNEVILVRTALAASAPNSGLHGMLIAYTKDLHKNPKDFAQAIESLSYMVARTYVPQQANFWAENRPPEMNPDITRALIMWAVDALDRLEGTPARLLPEQSIRDQGADLAQNRQGDVYLFDLAMALAFVADRDKLAAELNAREAFAFDRIGGNQMQWTATE